MWQMSLACLQQLVGFDDGCSVPDLNRLFVNKLPGWNSSLLGYLTSDQNPTQVDVFAAAAYRAAMRLEDDWRLNIMPKVSAPSVLDRGTIGKYQDGKFVQAGAAGKVAGVRITANGSAFTRLVLDTLTIFWPVTQSATVQIIDVLQGKVLTTTTINALAGQYVTIDLNYTIRSLGQALDIAVVLPAGQGAYDAAVSYAGCRSCGNRWETCGKNVYAKDVAFDAAGPYTDATASGIGHLNGVSVGYSLSCDYEAVLCQYADRLKRAMLYATTVEIMNEALFSKRINTMTTINRDDVTAMRDMYAEMYNEATAAVFGNLALPNDICYTCRPAVRPATYVP